MTQTNKPEGDGANVVYFPQNPHHVRRRSGVVSGSTVVEGGKINDPKGVSGSEPFRAQFSENDIDDIFKPKDLSWIKEFDDQLERIKAERAQKSESFEKTSRYIVARRLSRRKEREKTMPDDREYLDAKMEAQEHRLKSDIDRVENKLSNEVSAVRSEMTSEFAAVRADLKIISSQLENAPTRWTVWGTAITGVATMAALLFAVLGLMGDRFDAGVGMGSVVQQVQENKAENEEQGRKLDAILEILRDGR